MASYYNQSDEDERFCEYDRDNDYYLSDGNCSFVVDDQVLFKLHRSRLETDSAVFRKILPSSDVDWKRRKRAPPVEETIIDDTVKEFRALCWALYAKPSEIVAQTKSGTVKLGRMVNVMLMAQKYGFADIRDWAFSTLDSHFRNPDFECHNWTAVGKLLEFAYRNRKNNLAIRIEQMWLNGIMTEPEEGDCFVKALDTAERLNLRQFHGKAYHYYLKALGKFDPPDDGTTMQVGDFMSFLLELVCDLNDTQMQRAYNGLLHLAHLRSSLDKALPLDENPQCSNHVDCLHGWDYWWSSFLRDLSIEGEHLYDPEDFFQELEKRIMTHPILSPTGTREVFCQSLIKSRVCATKKRFQDTLADYFMIPARR